MKIMQKFIKVQTFLIIALILVFVPTGLYAEKMPLQASAISLSASLEKNVFRLNEEILINVVFSNESSKAIFLNTYFNLYWNENYDAKW